MNLKCFVLGHYEVQDPHDYITECAWCHVTTWAYGEVKEVPRSLNLGLRFYSLLNGWHYPGMRLSHKCPDCKKYDRVLRWRVGNHELCDDIPF